MSISTKQNRDSMIRLQKARRVLYGQIKMSQGVMIFVTLALPIAAALCAKFFPVARPYIAIASLGMSLFDAALFDRWAKRQMKEGAKLQEEFDCEVYGMTWNKFVVGAKVDREDVSKLNRREVSEATQATFSNWYSPAVDRLPQLAGRIACQRSNVRYDSSQRKMYCTILKLTISVIAIAVICGGLFLGETMSEFVLTSLVPATPIIIWLWREHNRHGDTVQTVERIKCEADKLWEKILQAEDLAPFDIKTRELQDAIFSFRTSSPLVFDWLNGLLRKGLESDMLDAVKDMVGEYERAKAMRSASA